MRMRLGGDPESEPQAGLVAEFCVHGPSLAEGRGLCHHRRMQSLADRIDRLNAIIGRAVSWLALVIVVGQFALVVARYWFGLGSIWLTEAVIYAHAALFLGAAAWTLRIGGHVRVDIFYADASPRTKAVIDLAGAALLLLPFMLVLIWLSVPYAARSWAVLERSQEASGLPLVFLLKTFIPVFAVLMALQGVAQAIRALAQVRDAAR
jgi:TRAP-type mannitol/chloroaromatic compound transport system permease small subunit